MHFEEEEAKGGQVKNKARGTKGERGRSEWKFPFIAVCSVFSVDVGLLVIVS